VSITDEFFVFVNLSLSPNFSNNGDKNSSPQEGAKKTTSEKSSSTISFSATWDNSDRNPE